MFMYIVVLYCRPAKFISHTNVHVHVHVYCRPAMSQSQTNMHHTGMYMHARYCRPAKSNSHPDQCACTILQTCHVPIPHQCTYIHCTAGLLCPILKPVHQMYMHHSTIDLPSLILRHVRYCRLATSQSHLHQCTSAVL